VQPGLFRLLLASAVLVSHFTPLKYGTPAVALFFVLSGYWISMMWRQKYRRTRLPYLTFVVSRFWRLLPVFILASLFAAFTTDCPAPTGLEWIPTTTLLGYSWLTCKPLGPAWSLDLEIQFYLIAPAILLLLAQGRLARLSAFALGVGCLFAVRFNLAEGGFLAEGIFYFLIGALAAEVSWRPTRLAALASVTLFFLYTTALLAHPLWRSAIWLGAQPGPMSAWQSYALTVAALLLVPFALNTVGQRSGAFDIMFGDLSYIVYMIHWPFVVFARTNLYRDIHASDGITSRLALIAILCIIIYTISVVIWYCFDQPINHLRARFVRGRLESFAHSSEAVASPHRLTS